MPKPKPLELACPRCGAGVGAKCRNHKNRPCKPHRERRHVHVPRVQPVEEIQDRVDTRNAIRQEALMHYMKAASICGPGAESYWAYDFVDRTGARGTVRAYGATWKNRPRPTVDDLMRSVDIEPDERLHPPFKAFFKVGKFSHEPGEFGFRWEVRFRALDIPDVQSAEKLHAAAVKRRDKVLAQQAAEAAKLAEWKKANETPSLFDAEPPS